MPNLLFFLQTELFLWHLANYFLKSHNVRNYYSIESDKRCYQTLKKINLKTYNNVNDINFKIDFDILISFPSIAIILNS